jgi:hypothetical protein
MEDHGVVLRTDQAQWLAARAVTSLVKAESAGARLPDGGPEMAAAPNLFSGN